MGSYRQHDLRHKDARLILAVDITAVFVHDIVDAL